MKAKPDRTRSVSIRTSLWAKMSPGGTFLPVGFPKNLREAKRLKKKLSIAGVTPLRFKFLRSKEITVREYAVTEL